MAMPQVAETYTEALQRLRDLAESKARNRRCGGVIWHWTNKLLGGSALVLGIIGGSAVLADNKIASPKTLGIAVLVGAICGSVGTFLRAEDRFFANKEEYGPWVKLVLDIDAASVALKVGNAPGVGVEQVVEDLGERIDTQLKSDAARRHS